MNGWKAWKGKQETTEKAISAIFIFYFFFIFFGGWGGSGVFVGFGSFFKNNSLTSVSIVAHNDRGQFTTAHLHAHTHTKFGPVFTPENQQSERRSGFWQSSDLWVMDVKNTREENEHSQKRRSKVPSKLSSTTHLSLWKTVRVGCCCAMRSS